MQTTKRQPSATLLKISPHKSRPRPPLYQSNPMKRKRRAIKLINPTSRSNNSFNCSQMLRPSCKLCRIFLADQFVSIGASSERKSSSAIRRNGVFCRCWGMAWHPKKIRFVGILNVSPVGLSIRNFLVTLQIRIP